MQGRITARRTALLDELLSLFLSDGFAAFTLEDLAARLRCSKTTLYALAPSKEQLVVRVVRYYFEQATAHVEARVLVAGDPLCQLDTYLRGVTEQLRPASSAFHDDVAAFGPAREIYEQNTAFAARRVRELITAGVAAGVMRPVNAAFVGAAVAQVMTAIPTGEIAAATKLDDAAAYRELAAFVLAALAP